MQTAVILALASCLGTATRAREGGGGWGGGKWGSGVKKEGLHGGRLYTHRLALHVVGHLEVLPAEPVRGQAHHALGHVHA